MNRSAPFQGGVGGNSYVTDITEGMGRRAVREWSLASHHWWDWEVDRHLILESLPLLRITDNGIGLRHLIRVHSTYQLKTKRVRRRLQTASRLASELACRP